MLGNRTGKKSFMRYIDDKSYQVLRFCLYAFIIFACHMTTAVLVQKVYKTPYTRTQPPSSSSSSSSQPQTSYFTNPFGIPIFNSTFALLYGILIYQLLHHNSNYNEQNSQNKNLHNELIKLSIVDLITNVLISFVIILTSFTMVNLINCCKLLAVVLFAIFFGKAHDKFKIGKRQVGVAGLICTGIIVFYVFGDKGKGSQGVDRQFGGFAVVVMGVVLMLEGFRPELVGQIREKYSPPPSYMYYQVSKYTLIFLLITSTLTTQLFSLLKFLWNHDRLSLDLTLIAILQVIGNTFIYRLAVLHKQHIIPMLTTIRKLCTSMFNIYYFHHTIQPLQYFGVFLVAFAVFADFGVGWLLGRGKGGFRGLGEVGEDGGEGDLDKGWQEEGEAGAVIGVF